MVSSDVRRKPDGTFAKGQSGYIKHGGEAAVKSIQHGGPLTGLAAEAERPDGAAGASDYEELLRHQREREGGQ